MLRFGVTALFIAVIAFAAWLWANRPLHKMMEVSAKTLGWSATDLEIDEGDSLEISATGKIVYWVKGQSYEEASPEGNNQNPCPHINCPIQWKPAGALVGRIGNNGTPFVVGTHLTFKALTSGPLYLMVNDPEPWDNSGFFVVTLTQQRYKIF